MTERKITSMDRTRSSGWSVAEWLLGIFGGIAVFLGFFVMFGPEDEFIGLGGDWSWRVGDVTDIWMYGLLIGGVAMLAGLAVLVLAGRNRVRVASTPLADLVLHTGVFAMVNAFVWAQDFALGSGLDYALWVTIPWAVVLLGHAVAYFMGRRRHGRIAPFETMLKDHADRTEYDRQSGGTS